MTTRSYRICNNCSASYWPALRKCPAANCRAPKRFSALETQAQCDERVAKRDQMEAFIQELAAQ